MEAMSVLDNQNGTRHYGKYRGTVTDNNDPDGVGRLRAQVPDVFGNSPSGWALPALPVAGAKMGAYLVPPVGSGVWIEFEQGDKNHPIWTGCWWGSKIEVPSPAQGVSAAISNLVLATPGQNLLQVSDAPGPTGGLMLKHSSGAAISVNDNGITLTNGKGAEIVLSGNSVNVNKGALEVR
jgi:uncharacterized protein involved in type VI secretion and phage assembly